MNKSTWSDHSEVVNKEVEVLSISAHTDHPCAVIHSLQLTDAAKLSVGQIVLHARFASPYLFSTDLAVNDNAIKVTLTDSTYYLVRLPSRDAMIELSALLESIGL